MHLLVHLAGRLLAVVLLCLATAIGWVMIDAHRSIETATAATAERVSQRLQSLYWQKLLGAKGWAKIQLCQCPIGTHWALRV